MVIYCVPRVVSGTFTARQVPGVMFIHKTQITIATLGMQFSYLCYARGSKPCSLENNIQIYYLFCTLYRHQENTGLSVTDSNNVVTTSYGRLSAAGSGSGQSLSDANSFIHVGGIPTGTQLVPAVNNSNFVGCLDNIFYAETELHLLAPNSSQGLLRACGVR